MGIVGEVLIGVVYLAIVYSLVRPSSPAAAVVQIISDALTNVVGNVTGYVA